MRILCAWCEHEGKAAEMGVREPLADPTVTHGLCPEHYTAVVQECPDSMLLIRKLQGYISQLEQQLQHLQSDGEGPWAQALRSQLDLALRDVASTLVESPPPSHEGSMAWRRAWRIAMRIHTQLRRHILKRSGLCLHVSHSPSHVPTTAVRCRMDNIIHLLLQPDRRTPSRVRSPLRREGSARILPRKSIAYIGIPWSSGRAIAQKRWISTKSKASAGSRMRHLYQFQYGLRTITKGWHSVPFPP